MGKLLTLVLGAAAGVLILRITSDTLAARTLDFQIASLKIPKLNVSSLLKLKLELVINIINRTPNQFEFNSFIGKVIYKGRTLTDVNANGPAVIKPDGISPLKFDLDVNTIDLIAELVGFLKISQFPTVTIVGTLDFKGLQIPVNQDVQLAA